MERAFASGALDRNEPNAISLDLASSRAFGQSRKMSRNGNYAQLIENVKHYYCEEMKYVDHPTSSPAAGPSLPHWGYEANGDDWGIEGEEQSPIDIKETETKPQLTHYLKLWWRVQPIQAKVEDNGHTIFVQAEVSRLVGTSPDETRRNARYEALQFHFHAQSEHTLEGKHYPLEMHIVHAICEEHFEADSPTRNLAVLGIFFEVDDNAPPHPFIESLRLDKVKSGQPVTLRMFDAFGKIDEPEFYGYLGSLTTPPCSEVVNWFVMKSPQKITSAQLAHFNFGNNGNNRRVQPIGNRMVYCGNCSAIKKFHQEIRPSLTPQVSIRTVSNLTGLLVLSFAKFKQHKRFPLFTQDQALLQPLSEVDRSSAINVYVSHAWLVLDDATEEPDNVHSEKYYLCVRAVEAIMKQANQTAAYLWIDCACMNLDSAEPKPLWAIMEFADCMLTPVPGDDVFSLSSFSGRYSYFSDYHAHLWNGSRTAYINRASCRMDMLYAAAVPISEAQLEKSKTFGSGLFLAMREGRRAHFLFGSKEQRERSSPVYLPPLQYSYLEALYPLKGYCGNEKVRVILDGLMDDIKTYVRPPISTYNGHAIKSEEGINGRGERVYPSGDRYIGLFSGGTRHGRGIYFYAGGETCEGDWRSGMSHGYASILYADGSTYEGRVSYDTLDGKGTMKYFNGDTFVGKWKRNKPHGSGVYTWSSGSTYNGGFFQGVFHGDGLYLSADGKSYVGVWNKGTYIRHFAFPLEKQGRWISKLLMVDISSLRLDNMLKKRSIDNAAFRKEHCGHISVQPESEPDQTIDSDEQSDEPI